MIKKLASYIGEYKKSTILTPIFTGLEVIMEVIMPFIIAKLIDDGITPGNLTVIWTYGALLILCCLISLSFGVMSVWYASDSSAGFAKNLRREMFHKVQDFSFSNIDKFSTASIVTRLTTDVTNVQNAFRMVLGIAVRAPFTLVFALIASYSINAKLATVYLCSVPFLGIGLYLIVKKAHPIFTRVFKHYDKLNGVVQENIRGIRVVKSFVREDHEIKKFDSVSKDIYNDFSKAEKLVGLNAPLMQLSMYVCSLVVSYLGAKMIIGQVDGLTTGLLTSLISYATRILMSLMMLSMFLVMITISRASAERIVELLDEESTIKAKENPIYEVPDGSISFKNVNFSYGKKASKNVLCDINIDIKSGQTVGIIGGTGSSKSSFVQMIPRLYDVTEGSVSVGGIDVRDYDLDTLRNSVAMVLQKNILFSGTIKENLRWGNPDATDKEIIRASKMAEADEFIKNFPDGYDTYLEEGGTNVSGGQKQRLCIARALLKNPKILILDDSTSAVDTKTDSLIRKAFKTAIPNTTKLIVAQRIASVEDADVILILDEGKIVAKGTHEELLECSEIYREIYESQTKGGDNK